MSAEIDNIIEFEEAFDALLGEPRPTVACYFLFDPGEMTVFERQDELYDIWNRNPDFIQLLRSIIKHTGGT